MISFSQTSLLSTEDIFLNLFKKANGGKTIGTSYGAGGGGRIAMFYKNLQHWFGSFQAFGGTGKPNPGGAGTIYLKVCRLSVTYLSFTDERFDKIV